MLPLVFAAESLDLYFNNQAKNGEHTAIKLWQCPSCQKPIYTALRYNIYIKTEIALVNQIKRQQEEVRQRISQREKQDIIEAMNTETKMSVHNIVGGRWFVCENGHPYYIGKPYFFINVLCSMLIAFYSRRMWWCDRDFKLSTLWRCDWRLATQGCGFKPFLWRI